MNACPTLTPPVARRGRFAARIASHAALLGLSACAVVLCTAVRPALAAEASASVVSTTTMGRDAAPDHTTSPGAVRTTPPESVASAAPVSPFGPAFVQVSESTLDGMRGGFTTDAGIQVSFGIERTVMVGGSVVSTTAFNVAAGASTGPTLVSSAGIGSGQSLLTAIQNSTNGQKIQTLTTVNVTANSLQVLRQGNLQALVGGGIAAALQR